MDPQPFLLFWMVSDVVPVRGPVPSELYIGGRERRCRDLYLRCMHALGPRWDSEFVHDGARVSGERLIRSRSRSVVRPCASVPCFHPVVRVNPEPFHVAPTDFHVAAYRQLSKTV